MIELNDSITNGFNMKGKDWSVCRLNLPLISTTTKSPFWPLNPWTPGNPPRPCKQMSELLYEEMNEFTNQSVNQSIQQWTLGSELHLADGPMLLCGDSPAVLAPLFLQVNLSLLLVLGPLRFLWTLGTPIHPLDQGHQSEQLEGHKHSHQNDLKHTGRFEMVIRHHRASSVSVKHDDTMNVVLACTSLAVKITTLTFKPWEAPGAWGSLYTWMSRISRGPRKTVTTYREKRKLSGEEK